uniref:hypothetical protein n=1 Tax=Shewanella sp. TaxID=50422 RepID=UPI004047FA3A
MTADDIFDKYFNQDLINLVGINVLDGLHVTYTPTSDIDFTARLSVDVIKVTDSIKRSIDQLSYYTTTKFIDLPRLANTVSHLLTTLLYNNNPSCGALCFTLRDYISLYATEYSVKQIDNDIPNTVETWLCLFEVFDLFNQIPFSLFTNNVVDCMKKLINTRYNDLDETDQFTVTLATGYKYEI